MQRSDFFGNGKETINGNEWSWDSFVSTNGFPVNDDLLQWVIGQDKALQECFLCLDEWTHKLRWMKKEKWFKNWDDPNKEKPTAKKFIPAGPYIFLVGNQGTGKSLIGRALANYLTELYKKENINIYDVLCWENKLIPSEPKISCHLAGEGKKIVMKERVKSEKKKRWFRWGFKTIQTLIIGFGALVLGITSSYILYNWFGNTGAQTSYSGNFFKYLIDSFISNAQMFYLGIGALSMGAMLVIFKNLLGSGIGVTTKGIGGAESTDAPKLIVNNSEKVAPFVDATGHKIDQLFGSLAWDPFQSGGLGTPEHQRVSAGDVHKANLGILYIDEIKNLHPEEAVTLLTVLEEGQLPVTLRGGWTGGGTSAMVISTEPIPCLNFLVCAGNFDSINMIHPALMDRIYGYGKVVRMNNDMPNTVENRRKYVQFISQEVRRFHLIPFSREACEEITDEGRRRSGKRNSLTTKFRPLISIIKTSATLAMRDKKEIVEREYVKQAINEHCKTIQRQILEHNVIENRNFLDINPTGEEIGQIYGLGVHEFNGEMVGEVTTMRGSLEKRKTIVKKSGEKIEGGFEITGVAKGDKAIWITDSTSKVRTVILQKYGIDINQNYLTHIDFAQETGVDGPSAGITMTLLLCSLIEKKPLKQDVAVTGEINIGVNKKIKVTAIGGVHEKIKAAEAWGFKKVLIPMTNYEHSIDPKDYTIEIIGCRTLDDYLKHITVEK